MKKCRTPLPPRPLHQITWKMGDYGSQVSLAIKNKTNFQQIEWFFIEKTIHFIEFQTMYQMNHHEFPGIKVDYLTTVKTPRHHPRTQK